ncbi:[FeFe] hydrogenase H-cluster maturation GTPase HydF [Novisyntrophococcus fermenticellae]|uniref:[FeFe] hydrogenase H-cluster maturation GTPase HydF n=1 Tax=Novisyntrophococcus fermenticellae TaxID=2068655 RepID=UPI001E376F73|nr:[FeFe] hydrogenase H-cluster maturation GTPase HydF [Novisyntrophococcus fermenticellae]
MGLNDTPSANRLHIAFFGQRNAGKSSLVNAVTGQDLAVVSDTKGTTTDPVYKSMELLPLGPVMIIDTPGFDDTGTLGTLRIKKTRQVLNKTDIAILVIDGCSGKSQRDQELLSLIRKKEIPYLEVFNKADQIDIAAPEGSLLVSTKTGQGIQKLKEKIGTMVSIDDEKLHIVGDIIQPSDFVLLVVPIDSAAPKGRLILPQQQTIRDILEADASAIVVKENELKNTLEYLGKRPALVITDSQVFGRVSKEVPPEIPLTSFSILMARYKGFLDTSVRGVHALDFLKEGDKILIAEGCTHHRQCDDIGTVKLPRWLRQYTAKKLIIETSSGTEYPEDLSPYSLIIHCGGCMLGEREVRYRMKCAVDGGIPFTNYGIAIAHMHGILKRCLEIFPQLLKELET